MSLAARQYLVSKLVFQHESQKQDLLNPAVTKTELIALLLDMVHAGLILEITAVKSDHHDDSNLGYLCHFNGFCADCWPLADSTPGNYLDANDPRFQSFLRVASQSVWLHQIGLAGSAWTHANEDAAGKSSFQDDGGDHVHLGASDL